MHPHAIDYIVCGLFFVIAVASGSVLSRRSAKSYRSYFLGSENKWWIDVLENGPSSYYAHFFDVDWGGDDRVLLPILGERYGRALTSGVLALVHDGAGRVHVRAHDHRLPLAPRSLGAIVRRAGERIGHVELGFVGDALTDRKSVV